MVTTSGMFEIPRDRNQAVVDDALLVDALVLHLEEEISGAEDVAIGRGRGDGLLRLFGSDLGRDLALQAAAEADQAFRMLCQQLLVDARLVVEALGVTRRDELDEVLEALLVLGEQHEVVRGLAGRAALVAAIARCDVDLAAENRIDAALPRRIVKHDGREHVAVLGDGQRRHLELLRLIEQLVDAARTIEQRELGVEVQVDELRHGLFPPAFSALAPLGISFPFDC